MKNPSFLTVSICLLAGILLAGCGEKDEPAQTKVDTGSKSTKAEFSTQSAVNIDSHPGKSLHDSSCISCHDSAVYTREDRKIGDFPKLLAQVKRCDANLGSRLFDEEIAQVADYLNQAYYQYDK